MTKTGRIIWYSLRVLYALGIVLMMSLVAALLLSFVPVNNGYAQSTQDTVEIFVTSNGIHTDLILPVKTDMIDWRDKIPLHHFSGADSTHESIAFGWGDRKFYMETPEWSDLTLKVALSAIFWPTPSAMHVEYIPTKLNPAKHQRPVQLTADQYKQLVSYIKGSFQTDNDDEFMLIPDAGYTSEDNFYEAKEKFFFPKNCNNWVNSGLKAAGVKTALWAPFPFAIMRHLR